MSTETVEQDDVFAGWENPESADFIKEQLEETPEPTSTQQIVADATKEEGVPVVEVPQSEIEKVKLSKTFLLQ